MNLSFKTLSILLMLLVLRVTAFSVNYCADAQELYLVECPSLMPKDTCSCFESFNEEELQGSSVKSLNKGSKCCQKIELDQNTLTQELRKELNSFCAPPSTFNLSPYLSPDRPLFFLCSVAIEKDAPPLYLLYQSFLC